jgi:hypothetical protein
MFVIAPLWFILIVLALTHPLKAVKYGFACLVGGAIGFGLLTVIVAAYGSGS